MYFDVTDGGNFEGKTILANNIKTSAIAFKFNKTEDEVNKIISEGSSKLLDIRDKRTQPGKDDKVLTAWNGLMISAFVKGYRVSGNSKYLDIALTATSFYQQQFEKHGVLQRVFKDGKSKLNAYLDDYAYLANAVIDMFEITGKQNYLNFAIKLSDHLIEHFWDDRNSNFFFTADDHEKLIIRPKSNYDLSMPSGNSVAVNTLLRLYHITREEKFHKISQKILESQATMAAENPFAFGYLLNVLYLNIVKPTEITILDTQNAKDLHIRLNKKFLPESANVYKTKVANAQEAHEAIRPTSIFHTPEKIRKYLNNDQFRLYKLIWNRMVCSQMPDALFDQTKVEISANKNSDKQYSFTSVGTILKFDGYRTVYMESEDDTKDVLPDKTRLPDLIKGDHLNCLSIFKKQHFTEPPPLYTEATLIKLLEEKGIGRPSTYASVMGTIQDRYYVQKINSRFVSTKLGKVVNSLLTQHFTDTMNVGFTAKLETYLDEIASGEREWVPVIKEFYVPFHNLIKKSEIDVERVPRSEIDEESNEVCETCERPMVINLGRYGRFLSRSGFPECKNGRPLVTILDVNCPQCESKLVEKQRKGRANKTFYGCSGYPECTFATNRKPISEPCPECSGLLVMWGQNRARCVKCPYKGTVKQNETTNEQLEVVV